jgi:hypothetical protein
VCHSTMAVLEHGHDWGWLKGEVSPLIKRCEELMQDGVSTALAAW